MLGFILQPNLQISHFGGNPTTPVSKERSVKSIRYLHLPNREDFTAFNLARSLGGSEVFDICVVGFRFTLPNLQENLSSSGGFTLHQADLRSLRLLVLSNLTQPTDSVG